MKSISKFAVATTIVALAVSLSACSDASSDVTPTADSSLSADAQAALDSAYAGVGSDLADLPAVTPESGKNLYVVSCGESVASCALNAAAMKAAGEAVGWTVTIADGKLSPDGFAAAIRQGVAGGADVIIPVGIGCGVAQAAFQEAVDAGITIVGGGGVDDCDPKLWATQRLWLPDVTPIEQWNTFGGQQAEYAFGKNDGDVKAVVLNFTTQVWGQWLTDGVNAKLDELGGGEVVETVDVSDPETADGSFIQKVTTALLSHPEANTLIVPVDGWLSNGLAAAIVQAGLDDQLLVIGRGGDAPALDLIRQGNSGIDATIGFAYAWGAWGSVDTAIRVFAGLEPQYIGEPSQAVDADNNMPASGQYDGNIDYIKVFETAWGVN